MKKLMATLLTGCLVLQSCIGFSIPAPASISAKTVDINTAVASSVQPQATKASTSHENVTSTESASALEVEVLFSSSIPYTNEVSVTISNGSTTETQKLNFSDVSTEATKSAIIVPLSESARFDMPAGEYTITVSTDKFAAYQQTIKLEANWIHKIQISPNKMTTDGVSKPGWIQIGDVNQDAIVDDTDKDTLLSDIREDSEISNPISDLNNDGKVDIADLQLLVQNLKEEKLDSSIEKLKLYKDVTLESGTTIVGDGKADDIAKGQSILLTPTNGEDISDTNPIELSFPLAKDNVATEKIEKIEGLTILAPIAEPNEDGTISSEIANGEAEVTYIDDTGKEQTQTYDLQTAKTTRSRKVKAARISAKADAKVTTDANGSLILNFGEQIAVKRVTIKITGTTKDTKLVNIAKVEFVNNMAERIPAPELSVPTLNAAGSGDQMLTASWTKQLNVTGYELYVSGPVKRNSSQKEEQIIRVSNIKYTVSAINDKELVNFEEYTLKVRSVNGDWKSPWSNEVVGKPEPTSKPDKPDAVSATGGYRSVRVTWKAMDDARGYMVYYKKSTESEYQPVVKGFQPVKEGTGRIETNSYTIDGLEDTTEYSVYVISWNELGWGPASLVSKATTKGDEPPQLPNYKLLNTSNGKGTLSAHIITATSGSSGKMKQSPLDTKANSALGLVDDDYGSYWSKSDWDDGVTYPDINNKGVFVTLDNDYKMNYMTFAATDEITAVNLVRIDYWNSETSTANNVGARLIRKVDEYGNPFYIVKFDSTITANRIHMALGRSSANRAEMKIGEIHFHTYDSLEDDIMGLYTDEMHTTLRSDVTSETIQTLETRLETVDQESGEKHPLYNELKLELKTATEILTSNLAPAYEVDNRITAAQDGGLGFSGLNAWQPLGKVAYAGETLLVYVGHNTKRTGDSTNLQLIMTQYHAESGKLSKGVGLKVGRNEITVPATNSSDFEKGGQLYIAYTGNNTSDKYAVRISGGSDIPVLNVYKKTGTERTNAIKTYIEELESYVKTIESEHNKIHKNGANAVKYDYNQTNCILNATDIMMEKMMYSLPATQVWGPLASKEDKVTHLDNALKAMEDTMTLFYQHKGLSNAAEAANRGKNTLPTQHLNIRYMRMFAGAFMYAAGNHIGIEYGSTTCASGATSWNSFGWGIAHEIGHDINQGTYAIAEITNNYFAQLLTIPYAGTRFRYPDVYKKVTSGTIGRSSNGAVQLALYWQLHLAFDNNKDDRHIFDNYEDQFNNLFFARVDTYSRNPGKAPQAGLTLNGGVDQNLMRLSCAAANKNILPFFERWGMVPNADTIAYAEKYGKADTKALYYVNDDARDYRADHPDEANTIKDKNVVTASASAISNQVEITINTNQDKELILGYEIIRSMTSNGKTESKVIGFTPIDTKNASTVFVDTVSTINNRVMSYEVKAVDKFLNYSNSAFAGSIKIQTDGVLNKDSFTVETTMTSEDDTVIEFNDDDPDSGYDDENVAAKTEHSIDRIIDNNKTDADKSYHGTISGNSAEIVIDMHETKEVTALKYLGDALALVNIEVSEDNITWTKVKENYQELTGTEEQTIWFDSVKEEARNNWIGTYHARYIKLTLSQTGSVSIQEIDICGPSGDNLEFMTTQDNQPAIGVLTADYQYGKELADVVSAGSLIFTGTYKGNPAYNVVMLYDTEGNVIGAKDGEVEAKQVIFADVPKKGNLGETSDGTWIYYVEPGHWDESTLKNIKGVRGELYRVDDALTLEGERMVSDTQIITIPTTPPSITLTGKTPEE